MRIMFVCHGNICRSPMAEMIFKHLIRKAQLDGEYFASSSATSDEEIRHNGEGNPIHQGAKEALVKNGIFCEEKRATRLRKSDYSKYNYFVGMDSANLRNMNLIFGGDPDNKIIRLNEKDVDDPWYTGDFDLAFKEIYDGCLELLKRLIIEECIS